MERNEQVYIKRIQNEMRDVLEKGTLQNPIDQCTYVDTVVTRLLMVKDKKIVDKLLQYCQDQEPIQQEIERLQDEIRKKIDEKINRLQDEIRKKIDEKINNVKEIYEEIKKI